MAMEKAHLLALYDKEQRQEVEYPNVQREVTADVVRHVNLSGNEGGMVIYSRLDAGNADRVILEQITRFEAIGQDFEWKVYDHDTPADLKARLQAHGFEVEDSEAIMVLDLVDAPAVFSQPVRHNIQRIADPERITDVMYVEERVWQREYTWMGEILTGLLRQHPQHLSVYVAYADSLPVSCAWTTFHMQGQFAGLWGGSTLSDYRGRGFYTALLATRAQEALQRGVRFLTVDASPMSRPILEKLGFQLIAYADACKWTC